MNLRGESSHDNKRLRLDNHQHCRLLESSLRAKEKHIIEKKAFLYVNVIRGVDIDCGFRSVTHSRYYQVESWINPGEEFRTRSVSPKVCKSNLDPIWNQGFIMPLRGTSVEDATLHLDVLRESNDVLDPGTSHMIKLVGKVQFRLDQLYFAFRRHNCQIRRFKWLASLWSSPKEVPFFLDITCSSTIAFSTLSTLASAPIMSSLMIFMHISGF